MAGGKDIADRVPAPDKLKSGSKEGGYEADDGASDETADEDKAARVSRMQEFMDALGLTGGDAADACDKLDQYLDSRK